MDSRGLLLRLALALTSTIAALLIVELALRLQAQATDPARADAGAALEASRRADLPTDGETASLLGLVRPHQDPSIVYELKPGLEGSFLGEPVHTNSHGLRGPEVELLKQKGIRRIAGLGDSVMFGWGVTADAGYMGILADGLRTDERLGIEILNFAVPGYNTAMEVATFRSKVLDFEPDLLLLHVINNDFDLPRFLLEPRDVWTIRRSYLLDLVRGVTGRNGGGKWLQTKDLEGLTVEERDRVTARYQHLAGENAFRSSMAELAEACGRRGIPVLVVVLSCTGEMWSVVCASADEHGFTVLDMGRRLGRYLVDNKLENTREGWIDAFWLSPSDPHLSELAHEIYAEAIVESLGEMDFLDR